MARTVPKNTIVVEVSDFSKLSSTERTAATNWMTAVAAQIVANGASLKRVVAYTYPPKGGRTVPAGTIAITVSDFYRLSSTERTAATDWLTAIIAQVVAKAAATKNKTSYVYPPKG